MSEKDKGLCSVDGCWNRVHVRIIMPLFTLNYCKNHIRERRVESRDWADRIRSVAQEAEDALMAPSAHESGTTDEGIAP